MTWQRKILAALLVPTALTGWNATAGAQEKPRAIETGKPKQATERPFGGPPNRSPGAAGKQCATESAACPLEKPLKLGTECSCPGQNGQQIQGMTECGCVVDITPEAHTHILIEYVFDIQDARVAGEHPADRDHPDRHIQEPMQRGPAADCDLAAAAHPDQDNRGLAAGLIPAAEQAQQDPACDAEVVDRPVASIGGYGNLENIPEGDELEQLFRARSLDGLLDPDPQASQRAPPGQRTVYRRVGEDIVRDDCTG